MRSGLGQLAHIQQLNMSSHVSYQATENERERRRPNSGGETKPEKASNYLLTWWEVPQHLQFNPYIHTGYRSQLTLWGCIKSLFYLHNETINILSHVFPVIVILSCLPWFLPWRDISVPFLPYTHVIACLAPWIGSAVYHLFMNHYFGPKIYYRLLQMDMLGIWVIQSIGALPTVIAAAYCLPRFLQIVILAIHCILSLIGLRKAMSADTPWERRQCFVFLLLLRACLIFIRMSPYGGGHPDVLLHVVLQDLVPIVGAAIGAIQIPERWLPGQFDFYLNSHNIMHILVVLATGSMHVTATYDMTWLSQSHCPGIFGTRNSF